MEPVRRRRTRALLRDIDRHQVGQAKQLERLVQQMRPEIEPQARTRPGPLAPPVLHHRPEAVDMRIELHDRAQAAALDGAFDGEEVTVPAAVLKHRQQRAGGGRGIRQPARLRQGDGEGLVHHDMLAGGQRRLGERGVAVIGRGDDDEVGTRPGRGGMRIGQHGDARRGLMHLVRRAARPDRHQVEPRNGTDERGMEGAPDIAVADQGGADGGDGGHGGLMSGECHGAMLGPVGRIFNASMRKGGLS
jgi:hypothetical protein